MILTPFLIQSVSMGEKLTESFVFATLYFIGLVT